MRTDTRKYFNHFQSELAKTYQVESMSNQFNVDIPQETQLNNKIQESIDFLNQITTLGVTDTRGQALELGVNGLLAKRTDVSKHDREPHVLGGPTGSRWEVHFTEFDVAINYVLLDQWARYKDFASRYMNMVYRSIGLARLTVGFYGVSPAEAESDPVNHPLGQDLNKGWFQILKEQNPANFLTDAGDGWVRVHADTPEGKGYRTLDGLVADLYAAIKTEHRTGHEVALIGSGLLAADSNKVYNEHGTTPTEKNAIHSMLNSYGGLRAMSPSRFPEMGVMVTDPKNLHLYYQEGRTRRHTVEQSERNRIVDFISSNETYAIGNLLGIAAVDPEKVVLSAG